MVQKRISKKLPSKIYGGYCYWYCYYYYYRGIAYGIISDIDDRDENPWLKKIVWDAEFLRGKLNSTANQHAAANRMLAAVDSDYKEALEEPEYKEMLEELKEDFDFIYGSGWREDAYNRFIKELDCESRPEKVSYEEDKKAYELGKLDYDPQIEAERYFLRKHHDWAHTLILATIGKLGEALVYEGYKFCDDNKDYAETVSRYIQRIEEKINKNSFPSIQFLLRKDNGEEPPERFKFMAPTSPDETAYVLDTTDLRLDRDLEKTRGRNISYTRMW